MSTSVSSDLNCARCGYNLRTLPVAGLCPECGSPIAESLDQNWLQNADRAWLSRLSTGAGLVLVSMGVAVLALLCSHSVPSASLLLFLLAEALGGMGAWLLTTPGHWVVPRGGSNLLRRATRGLYGISLTGDLLNAALLILAQSSLPEYMGLSTDSELPLFAIMAYTRYVVLVLYLHPLASQIPSGEALWSSRFVIGGALLCGAGVSVSLLLELLLSTFGIGGWAPGGPPPASILGTVLPAILICAVVAMLVSVALFVQYRREFIALANRR